MGVRLLIFVVSDASISFDERGAGKIFLPAGVHADMIYSCGTGASTAIQSIPVEPVAAGVLRGGLEAADQPAAFVVNAKADRACLFQMIFNKGVGIEGIGKNGGDAGLQGDLRSLGIGGALQDNGDGAVPGLAAVQIQNLQPIVIQTRFGKG